MLRSLSIIIADVLPSAVILLLLLAVWLFIREKFWHKPRYGLCHTLGMILFALYLLAVCSVVGIPSIQFIHLDFSFNLLPLVDMLNEPRAILLNLLNVLLFVPLGLLLPAFWPDYRSLRRTALAGLGLSLSIELIQIFSWRLTDIDDLLTNTLGAVLGYLLFSLIYLGIKKQKPVIEQKGESLTNREPWLIWLICLLFTIFVYPILPEELRNWFLYTPFWH